MKKLYTLLIAVILTAGAMAQAPEKMSYQAVIRDVGNALVTSQSVGMQISILQGSVSGTSVYVETQTPTTNVNGLVSIEIGSGTVVSGTFNTLDWSTGPYFIKTETDPTGGTTYTITGTSQLMSVPYAFHANTADSIVGGPSSVCSLSIGDTLGGGIIFYLDASGCHGLISAPTDQSSGIVAYNGVDMDTYAYGSGIGFGDGNTSTIRKWVGSCAGCYAADLCYNLSLGGYNDWYLPSKYELNLMYENIGQGNLLGLGNIGGFANSDYWSSTEFDSQSVWNQDFTNGSQNQNAKFFSYYVRAIRAF